MREGRQARAERETFLALTLDLALNEGVEHWADVLTSDFSDAGAPHGGADAGGTLMDRRAGSMLTVTPKAVAQGYRTLLGETVPGKRWANLTRDRLLQARRDNLSGELDGPDADLLVQLGLFGTVRYFNPRV